MSTLGAATATSAVVTDAKRYLGVPYVYGGDTPTGFDCSGFTYWVYPEAGAGQLPRTSEQQALVGSAVSAAQANPGDLVLFSDDGKDWSHVGIYEGAGRMIDAPHTGASVREEPVAGFAPFTMFRSLGAGLDGNAGDAVGGTGATTVADITAQPAGLLSGLLPSVPWLDIGLGLLGGVMCLVGVLLTFRRAPAT